MQCKKCGKEIIGEIQRYCNDCKKEIESKHIRNTKILANQEIKPMGLNKLDLVKQEELVKAAKEAISNTETYKEMKQTREVEDLGATKIFTIPKEMLKEASMQGQAQSEAMPKAQASFAQLEKGVASEQAEVEIKQACQEVKELDMVEESQVSPVEAQSRVEYIKEQREAREQLFEQKIAEDQSATSEEKTDDLTQTCSLQNQGNGLANVSEAEKEGLLMGDEDGAFSSPKKKGCLWRILELLVVLAGIVVVFIVGCAIGFKLLPMLPF